eukprot:5415502-Prymnesium_polylepis.1
MSRDATSACRPSTALISGALRSDGGSARSGRIRCDLSPTCAAPHARRTSTSTGPHSFPRAAALCTAHAACSSCAVKDDGSAAPYQPQSSSSSV